MKHLYPYLVIVTFLFCSTNVFAGSENENPEKDDAPRLLDRITNDDIEVVVPSVIFNFKNADIKLKFKNPQHSKLSLNNNKLHFIINGEDTELEFTNGEATYSHKFNDEKELSIYVEEFSFNQKITTYPLWGVLLPIILIVLFIIRKMTKKKKKKIFPTL